MAVPDGPLERAGASRDGACMQVCVGLEHPCMRRRQRDGCCLASSAGVGNVEKGVGAQDGAIRLLWAEVARLRAREERRAAVRLQVVSWGGGGSRWEIGGPAARPRQSID